MATLSFPASAQEAVTTDAGTFDQQDAEQAVRKPPYSPYAGRNFPTRPFFGDTHLHTAVSFDAGAFGARLTPRTPIASPAARITASSGQPVKLSRPLDFLVVADHSDNMGFFPKLLAGDPAVLADVTGRRWYDLIQSGQGADAAVEMIVAFSQGTSPEALLSKLGRAPYRTTWRDTMAAAEAANEPGRFTAFIGYEWTSNTGANNLHRNVIFRDGETRASLVEPFTVLPPGSDNPGNLWQWATENTREALFDAMERRETYATTGSRMIVRFFGGWDFEVQDARSRLPAMAGYTKGVPMGGDLRAAPAGKSPNFLIAALKDPLGANLDRIQIVKGWLDQDGQTRERVYDVVWGDAEKRRPGADGKLPPVGNTVDVANALWTNTIGDPELIVVWQDPEFDPALKAFYYARVIEIPTPRWTAYDARRFGTKMPPEAHMTTQERAYTSPIWYTPGE